MSSNRRADTPPGRGRRPRSLRSRLLAGQVLVVSAVCLGVGAANGFALHQFLMGRLDSQLTYTAQRAVQIVGGDPADADGHPADSAKIPGATGVSGPGPGFIGAPGQPLGTFGAIVEDGQVISGGMVTSSDARIALPATADAEMTRLAVDGVHTTQTIRGLGRYRVIARATAHGQTVVIGMPVAEAHATVLRVLTVFALFAAVALAAATTAGVHLVRRALAPLDRVAAIATGVADLRLDRGEVALPVRVPPADTDPRTEIGALGAAVNRMLSHIAGALSARHDSELRARRFLADASHELRTPLTVIRGYAELAQRNRSAVPADVAHAMSRVASEAERMSRLVEDMLLLARLDSGRPLERERVDVSAMTVEAVSDAHVTGPEHYWNLDLPDEPVIVTGDAIRLHQVLANLLANARTHTAPGTSVAVSLTTDPVGNAIWRVADNGPGIPVTLQPEVFQRFSRGDSSRSRRAGSTGLGLGIAEAIVKAHGGIIALHSIPGSTEFTVTLPRELGIGDQERGE
ncbi:sensor histidine kinase [Nocardia sp. NPDC056100]|uniref:sensor histidine kinase n=1 Tax=Nocardia sp. NPDC056100 TaxID=3345712 RepID=UPI0035E15699